MLSTLYAAGRSSSSTWAVDFSTRYLRSTRVSCGAPATTSASDTGRRAETSSGRASANTGRLHVDRGVDVRLVGPLVGRGLRPAVRRVRDRVAHGHARRLAD